MFGLLTLTTSEVQILRNYFSRFWSFIFLSNLHISPALHARETAGTVCIRMLSCQEHSFLQKALQALSVSKASISQCFFCIWVLILLKHSYTVTTFEENRINNQLQMILLSTFFSVYHCLNYRAFSRDCTGFSSYSGISELQVCWHVKHTFHFNIFAARRASEDTKLAFTEGSGASNVVSCIKS